MSATMAEARDGYDEDDRFVEDWEPWTAADEDASWVEDDTRQRRRSDR